MKETLEETFLKVDLPPRFRLVFPFTSEDKEQPSDAAQSAQLGTKSSRSLSKKGKTPFPESCQNKHRK